MVNCSLWRFSHLQLIMVRLAGDRGILCRHAHSLLLSTVLEATYGVVACYSAGLAIYRSRVRLLVAALSGSHLGQVVHMYSPSPRLGLVSAHLDNTAHLVSAQIAGRLRRDYEYILLSACVSSICQLVAS